MRQIVERPPRQGDTGARPPLRSLHAEAAPERLREIERPGRRQHHGKGW